MRDLAYEFFQRSPLMAAPLLAMLIFIGVFAVVIVRVVRARSDEMERSARLVLEQESNDVAP